MYSIKTVVLPGNLTSRIIAVCIKIYDVFSACQSLFKEAYDRNIVIENTSEDPAEELVVT